MERYLIICLTDVMGITPFVISAENKSEFEARLRIISEDNASKRVGLYAEVYRLLNNGCLEYKNCYACDGKDIYVCDYFVPSYTSLKNFFEKHSYLNLKL